MVVADAAVSDNDPTTVSSSSSSSASSPLDNNNDYGGDTSDTTSISSNGTSFNTSNNNNTIIVPSPKDILMGRGKRTMTSPGNIRLYMMLDDNFERYETAARNLKSSIAKDMVDQVKAKGCRFLEQVDGFWVQVDDTKARNKVSHDFRTLRSSKKSGSNSKETAAGGGADGKTSTKNNNTTKKANKRGRTN